MLKLLSPVLVAALVGLVPVASPATAEPAAARHEIQPATKVAGRISASRIRRIPGETTRVSVDLPGKAARPVVLQRWSGGQWRRVARKSSNRQADAVFTYKVVRGGNQLRAFAPATRVRRSKLPGLVTRQVRITADLQSCRTGLPHTGRRWPGPAICGDGGPS